jgi:hypothetical protein
MRAFVAAMVVVAALASGGAQDWEKADRATIRLPPGSFRELPALIQTELVRRGCTIPQPFGGAHQNVIKGRFTSATQTDWAVLCLIRRTSSILVFRSGSVATIVALAALPDSGSRVLGVADADFIRVHHQRYGGPALPPLDHDGIDDGEFEKGSLVRYWYRGHWLQLTGSN